MLELTHLLNESFFLNRYAEVIIAVEKGCFNCGLDHQQQPGQFASRHPSLFPGERADQSQSPDLTEALAGGKIHSRLDLHFKCGQIRGNPRISQFNPGLTSHNHPKIDSLNSLHPQKIVSPFQPIINPEKSDQRDRTTQTVVLWDEAARTAVRNTSAGPTIASRAYAIVHTAMYDAWASYDPVAIGTQLGDKLQRPPEENTLSHKSQAISYAAYTALIDLFPSQTQIFDSLMQQLGFDPKNAIANPQTPSGIGREAAIALLSFRHHDGSNQLNNYADTTNYQPVNAPDRLDNPNRWQPLRVPLNDPNGRPQRFLTPHWGSIIPFALTKGSQFRPSAPPELATPLYHQRVQEIIDYSANLTDEQKIIAEYWEDGPGTSFPPGKWMSFGQYISQRDNHSLDEDVKLFFMLANAVFDAGIAAWESKRYYDYIRPVSAIRSLFNGREIQAWAGPGKGTQTLDGSQWHPYQRLRAVSF
ncbi:MAG: phosphoesterase [Lyngbya sp.]|nr:phosphoesterase [Lyngbya sp.]